MNVLLSITSYHPLKQKYLNPILDAYSSFKNYNVTVALSTNYPYTPTHKNVVMIPSTKTLQDHCWSNKDCLKDHYQEYDLIAESDDDVQLTEANFDYYCRWKSLLPEYIPGLLTAEYGASGTPQLISMCPLFPPMYERLTTGNNALILPYNVHSAAFIADPTRYTRFLQNAPQVKSEQFRQYSPGAMARTAIYTHGGMKKVVSIKGIKDHSALANHLPVKYSNRNGIKFLTPEQIT